MDIVNNKDRFRSAFELYNAVTYFFKFLVGIEKNVDSKITQKTALALLSTYWLSLKEEMIIKEENLSYQSKLYSDVFQAVFQKIYEKIPEIRIGDKLADEATVFSIIRNKFAHGDFIYLEEDDLVKFESYGTPFYVKVNDLFEVYFLLQNNIKALKEEPVYERHVLWNETPKKLTKKLETEQEVEQFLKLCTHRYYYLRSMDKEPIPFCVKQTFDLSIEQIHQQKNQGKNTKPLEEYIRKVYEQQGYAMMIENKKIKDKNIIEKIKQAIFNHEQLKQSEEDMEVLSYIYGEIIVGVLLGENKKSLILGAMENFLLLKDEILKDSFFLGKRISYCYNELMAGLLIARFHTLYSQPLDDFYKKDNLYHLDRRNLFDFSQLKIEELKPNFIFYEKKGILQTENIIESGIQTFKKLHDRIAIQKQNKKNMEASEHFPLLKEKYQHVCESLENMCQTEEELWKTLVQKYHELQTIKQDYVENEKYFHNLAIIEGIRNSIAHGNIQILNATETENFHDVKIRFTDMEDEKIVFQLTVSLYELECLFEPCNINVINQYRKTKGV